MRITTWSDIEDALRNTPENETWNIEDALAHNVGFMNVTVPRG